MCPQRESYRSLLGNRDDKYESCDRTAIVCPQCARSERATERLRGKRDGKHESCDRKKPSVTEARELRSVCAASATASPSRVTEKNLV